MILKALFLIVFIVMFSDIYPALSIENNEILEKEIKESLKALQHAWEIGVDQIEIKPIYEKLNIGLELLSKAKFSILIGKTNEAEKLYFDATQIISNARNEALKIQQKANQKSFQFISFSMITIPIISLVTSIILIKSYEWYTSLEKKKIINTIIQRKKKDDK